MSPEPDINQQQAMLAIQGLEGLEEREFDSEPASLGYEGPRDPEALLAHLGYDSFRPGQRDAVQAALDGRDALVVMPTGGGKSLCYQLPGLASGALTIVVSPLIALMADQWRRLIDKGHPVAMIASGLGEERNRESLRQVAQGEARIIYCSPERFGSTVFLNALEGRKVALMAIDEAHCISEWGHDFRPDYLRLPRAVERLGRPTLMACTATATPEVAAEIHRRLGLEDPLIVRSGFDRPNLSFDIVRLDGAGSKARKLALLETGLADPANRPAIVYCGTRRDTDEIATTLRRSGRLAVAYHAGLKPDERASAQHRFMTEDADVVVATNAFGMGIDKANVRSVWHWAIPTSVEAYYQEAGRAGRDGDPARAVLLASRSDLGRLVRFNQQRGVEPTAVVNLVQRLAHGEAVIDNPRQDSERIALAIAEQIGAVEIEPAGGGRLAVTVIAQPDLAKATAACRVAADRGWRAYRAVEAFAYSETCRRRSLLDHFGDGTPGGAQDRCCDVCDAIAWLPDPATLPAGGRTSSKKGGSPREPVPELSGTDAALFEQLRAWRLRAARGKPAYTVANDRTLTAIAAARPSSAAELAEIHGIGPSFIKRYSESVLIIVEDAQNGGGLRPEAA